MVWFTGCFEKKTKVVSPRFFLREYLVIQKRRHNSQPLLNLLRRLEVTGPKAKSAVLERCSARRAAPTRWPGSSVALAAHQSPPWRRRPSVVSGMSERHGVAQLDANN